MTGMLEHSMDKQKRTGIILILIGVLLPLLLLLVTSNYDPKAGLLFNIVHLEIVIKGIQIKALGWTRIAIPYRFPLAACIFLLFLGIKVLDQARGEGKDRS